jgi:hypothetical protein
MCMLWVGNLVMQPNLVSLVQNSVKVGGWFSTNTLQRTSHLRTPCNVLPICFGVCAVENSQKGIDMDFTRTHLLVLLPVDAWFLWFFLVLNLSLPLGSSVFGGPVLCLWVYLCSAVLFCAANDRRNRNRETSRRRLVIFAKKTSRIWCAG